MSSKTGVFRWNECRLKLQEDCNPPVYGRAICRICCAQPARRGRRSSRWLDLKEDSMRRDTTCPVFWAAWRESGLARATEVDSALRLARAAPSVNPRHINLDQSRCLAGYLRGREEGTMKQGNKGTRELAEGRCRILTANGCPTFCVFLFCAKGGIFRF